MSVVTARLDKLFRHTGAALVALLFTAAALAGEPKFSDYPSHPINNHLKAIDWQSDPDANYFQSRLRDHLGEAPNFAGDQVLSYWGCGASCQMVGMVNAKSGRVTIARELIAANGFCYQADSRLLVVNPLWSPDEEGGDYFFKTAFYLWDGHQFKLLAKTAPRFVACDDSSERAANSGP
ncbi:hypothetical protein [Halioxenophilus sp. WMMB6]|uniref:hypothetical protein n=1 Tax=Halioxenophilus sp. WMMB6 TaxID=3073815 RepID=UPI00295F41CD|nr:hypothetical protein [Halioxenophilus sp. WMMB6]